jgi:hypothetical protein
MFCHGTHHFFFEESLEDLKGEPFTRVTAGFFAQLSPFFIRQIIIIRRWVPFGSGNDGHEAAQVWKLEPPVVIL